jgi:hypothetical protein
MKRNVSVVCVCSARDIVISGKIIKEVPGSIASGTHCINQNFLVMAYRVFLWYL